MNPVMTPSELAADALVRAYLNGRCLPKILHGAVVWVAATRLASAETPVLDETLRQDIDNQAGAAPAPAILISAPRRLDGTRHRRARQRVSFSTACSKRYRQEAERACSANADRKEKK